MRVLREGAPMNQTDFRELNLAVAERLARMAHAGQVEHLTGRPYVEHLERVVALLQSGIAHRSRGL